MSDTLVLGIDTGATGGLALGYPSGPPPQLFPLAPERVSRGQSTMALVDAAHLLRLLSREIVFTARRIVAFAEAPLLNGHLGTVRVAQTNRTLGRLEGALASLSRPDCEVLIVVVEAKVWRAHHGLEGGSAKPRKGETAAEARARYAAAKARSVEAVIERWPSLADELRPAAVPRLKKDGSPAKRQAAPVEMHDLAEAALIWAYGCAQL